MFTEVIKEKSGHYLIDFYLTGPFFCDQANFQGQELLLLALQQHVYACCVSFHEQRVLCFSATVH